MVSERKKYRDLQRARHHHSLKGLPVTEFVNPITIPIVNPPRSVEQIQLKEIMEPSQLHVAVFGLGKRSSFWLGTRRVTHLRAVPNKPKSYKVSVSKISGLSLSHIHLCLDVFDTKDRYSRENYKYKLLNQLGLGDKIRDETREKSNKKLAKQARAATCTHGYSSTRSSLELNKEQEAVTCEGSDGIYDPVTNFRIS